MKTKIFAFIGICVLIAAAFAGYQSAQAAGTAPGFEMTADSSTVTWKLADPNQAAYLVVVDPANNQTAKTFQAGEMPVYHGGDAPLNGIYTFELTILPTIDPEILAALKDAREQGLDYEELVKSYQASGALPVTATTYTGIFKFTDGQFNVVLPEDNGSDTDSGEQPRDVVQNDDVLVIGSLCVGFDCVNGENFGFDTIRLKENNVRIKFEDTSATSGFPSNDWQITINDSASGGLNYFRVDDITNSRSPLTIVAGAPTHSLYIDNSGRIGLKTATPVLELHLNDGDTPGIRLEQNNSYGWTAQTWDIAGNESNFFIRDVTGGSKLPFRIQPGAPTNTLTLKSDGSVGIGTYSPEAKLHVTGNVLVEGFITELSDQNAKHNFAPVNNAEILSRLAEIPVMTWNYKDDAAQSQHIGPMAQDFYAAYGLGIDDQHLAALDVNGVALASIQELYRSSLEKDAEIEALKLRVAELEKQTGMNNSGGILLPMGMSLVVGLLGVFCGAWIVRRQQR